MNRSRIVYCLLGWLLALRALAAEPVPIRYEGYDPHRIDIHYTELIDGLARVPYSRPASVKEPRMAFQFYLGDHFNNGHPVMFWPNSFLLGYYVTTERIHGERYVIFNPPDPKTNPKNWASRIALFEGGTLDIEPGYLMFDDQEDSLMRVFRGGTFTRNGSEYTVISLSGTQAVLKKGDGQEVIIPISSTGKLRSAQLKLRREMDSLQREVWSNYNDTGSEFIALYVGGSLLACFVAVYACIAFGLMTLEEQKTKPRKR